MIAELASVSFEYALICDDVRREGNGKFIFIGVYGNNILLDAFPATIRLRLVTRLIPKKHEFPLGIRVKRNGEEFAVMKGNVVSSELEPDVSPTPEFAVELTEPGILEFEVSDEEFDLPNSEKASWVSLLKIPVRPMGDS